MACLGCNKTCACYVSAGSGITVSGTGNTGAPWVISAVGASEFTEDTCSITMGGDGSLATPLSAALNIATAGGLKCTNAIGVGIKADPASTTTITFSSSGIKINNGPVFVTTPCLVGDGSAGDPIHIVYDPDGGIFCDSDGISIKLNSTCLALTSSGLAPVFDPDGGLLCDTDGLAIKLDPASTGVTFSTDGILITGGGGGGTVIADAPIIGDGSGGDHLRLDLLAAGGLDVSGGKLEIKLDPATDPACGSLSASGLLISCGGGGGGTSTVIIEDNFVRANENPVAPTPTGNVSPRMSGSGSWAVNTNKLAPGASVAENILYWNAASEQYVFECTLDVIMTDGGVIWGMDPLEAGLGTYILVNCSGAGTPWTLYYRAFGGFSGSLGTGIASTNAANGDVLKLVVDGANWSFYINGVLNWNTVGATGATYGYLHRQGWSNAGFRANNDTGFRCSHIKITSTCCGGAGGGLYTIDNPEAFADAFGPSIGYDQEFNRTTVPTTMPTGWAAINGNSGTYLEHAGRGVFHIPSGFNTINQTSIVARNIPVEASWTAWGAADTAWMGIGLVLTDGTKAVGIVWNPNPLVLIATWTNIAGTYFGNPAQENTGRIGFAYSRIIYAAANDISIAYSFDGQTWRYLIENYDFPTYLGGFTPTKIGFCMNQGAGKHDFGMDWFRVR